MILDKIEDNESMIVLRRIHLFPTTTELEVLARIKKAEIPKRIKYINWDKKNANNPSPRKNKKIKIQKKNKKCRKLQICKHFYSVKCSWYKKILQNFIIM